MGYLQKSRNGDLESGTAGTLDCGRNPLHFIGPDAAVVIGWKTCQILYRVHPGGNVAAWICSHHDDGRMGGFHSIQKPIRPAPKPWREINGNPYRGVAACAGDDSCPTIT